METSLRWLDMMQSLRGAADDWSLASESRYDRRRTTDLGNFAPRLTAGVMNKCVWNLLVSSVIFCRFCFVPLIVWHIFLWFIPDFVYFLICPGNLVSLKGSSNRCNLPLQVVFWVRLASMAYELSLTAMEPRDKDWAVDVKMSFSQLRRSLAQLW